MNGLAEGIVPELARVRAVRTISPSQFGELTKCSLKAVFREGKVRVLPSHPAAAIGSAIHRVLENISCGRLRDEGEIPEAFDREIEFEQKRFTQVWFQRGLVPFSQHIGDFFVRRAKALRLASDLLRRKGGLPGKASARAEFDVRTPDGKISGQIDYFVEASDIVTIVDYKTGSVTEDNDGVMSVKEAYQTQLQMYAAIFNENGEQRTFDLQLITPDGEIVSVGYDPARGAELLREARTLLARINEAIDAEDAAIPYALAEPGQVCVMCAYRPVCLKYLSAPPLGERFGDVVGTFIGTKALANGTHKLEVSLSDGRMAAVKGLKAERHPALNGLKHGDWVGIFNVRRSRADGVELFEQVASTTIYRRQ